MANITVVGVGGSGINVVNAMISAGIKGIDFVAMDTDIVALQLCTASRTILLGNSLLTRRGWPSAGGNPEIGKQAAGESRHEIKDALNGADLIIVTTGLGGGTGSGAIPVIAEVARLSGALTIGVVSKPFSFEGRVRAERAGDALRSLRDWADCTVQFPADHLLQLIDLKQTLPDAYSCLDKILALSIRGLTGIMMEPGLFNVVLADMNDIVRRSDLAAVGIGTAGEPVKALTMALGRPKMKQHINQARNVILNITGGSELNIVQVEKTIKVVEQNIEEDTRLLFNVITDKNMSGKVRATIYAIGIDDS